jgi:hypothetical protein
MKADQAIGESGVGSLGLPPDQTSALPLDPTLGTRTVAMPAPSPATRASSRTRAKRATRVSQASPKSMSASRRPQWICRASATFCRSRMRLGQPNGEMPGLLAGRAAAAAAADGEDAGSACRSRCRAASWLAPRCGHSSGHRSARANREASC